MKDDLRMELDGGGYYIVGHNAEHEVTVQLSSTIVTRMSVEYARCFGNALLDHANQAAYERAEARAVESRKAAEAVPVDYSARELVSGKKEHEDPGYRELNATGQQRDYVVLSAKERAKGFVRPVRTSYVHLKCGGLTVMGRKLAETYARCPTFYSGTFCCKCGAHFDFDKEDGKFVWDGTNERVGG